MTSTEKYQRLDVEDVIAKLKLSDKVALLSGTDNWHTYAVPSLRIPPVRVSDGRTFRRPANGYPRSSTTV